MARSLVEAMKIYTKTGDSGSTGLSGGSRVSKSNLRIAALGDIDELNAWLGICRNRAHDTVFELRIASIQTALFSIGAEISSPPGGRKTYELLSEIEISLLEESIDLQVDELEPLKNFILPGGAELGACFHMARAICRRAERSLVTLHESEPVREVAIRYLNRLSDWMFVAARTANKLANVEDIKWNAEG